MRTTMPTGLAAPHLVICKGSTERRFLLAYCESVLVMKLVSVYVTSVAVAVQVILQLTTSFPVQASSFLLGLSTSTCSALARIHPLSLLKPTVKISQQDQFRRRNRFCLTLGLDLNTNTGNWTSACTSIPAILSVYTCSLAPHFLCTLSYSSYKPLPES